MRYATKIVLTPDWCHTKLVSLPLADLRALAAGELIAIDPQKGYLMTTEHSAMDDDLWPDAHIFRDYLRLKAEVPTAILFLEMGAFLEAWGSDAVLASPILDVALTRRGAFRDGTPIPMCGIPADSRFTSAEGSDVRFIGSTTPYIKALVRAGYPVAIAVCQSTMPVVRRIEWTIWPHAEWSRDAARRWLH